MNNYAQNWVRLGSLVPAPSIARNWAANTRFCTDGQGVPLVIDTIPANTPDANQAVPLAGCRSSDRRQARPPPETPGPCDGGPGL